MGRAMEFPAEQGTAEAAADDRNAFGCRWHAGVDQRSSLVGAAFTRSRPISSWSRRTAPLAVHSNRQGMRACTKQASAAANNRSEKENAMDWCSR